MRKVLNDYGYEGFAKTRYSDQTIEQSTAIFGWGSDDVDTEKDLLNHSHKIHKTDHQGLTWKPFFSIIESSNMCLKTFLLIS